MYSYSEKVIIPFGGLIFLDIPIDEDHVRYKANADPDSCGEGAMAQTMSVG